MKHKKNCECKVCKLKSKGYSEDMALYLIHKEENAKIKKYGFITHFVYSPDKSPWANYHTHGLAETKRHLDLQIVLPINPELAQNIIWSVVKLIDNKRVLKDGDLVDGVIQKYPIKLKKVTESNREVLRIILPDENGLFYDDKNCTPLYAAQEFAKVIE